VAGALVAGNLVPLGGALFFGWETFLIIYLYWWESIVVAAMNVAKLIFHGAERSPVTYISGVLASGAFAMHFGLVMLFHGLFILSMFGEERLGWSPGDFGADFIGPQIVAAIELAPFIWPGVVALLVSHGFSFWQHYIVGGEYRRADIGKLMLAPYRRVAAFHIVLCFGGLAIVAAGDPVGMVALLVVVKIVVDLYAHVKEHPVL